MKILTMTVLAVMAAAAPAWAQQGGPTTDLSKVEGGRFAIDRAHARILFSYNHLGYSIAYGQFTDFSGSLSFDPKTPAASELAVTVNMNGIDTTVAKLDDHLKSAEFFDAAKYPTASFKSTKIVVTGPTTGTITGDLTLHGVTKPVTLEASFNGGGVSPMVKAYDLGFNATGHVKRSDFEVAAYVPMVSDDVLLTISAEFDRIQ